jgi:AcrR family transcriptional regulator
MTSKERIFSAAVQVFAKKGRHGAKMEEIASVAQINKAMIYYLFTSKDNLYLEVLKMIISVINNRFFKNMENDTSKGLSPDKLLIMNIERQFDAFSENPDHTKILIEAMSTHAEEILPSVRALNDEDYRKPKEVMEKIISDGKSQGLFRDIDSENLMTSIFGMNLIFFMTKSFADILGNEIGDEAQYLEKRKKNIIDLVMNGIMCKN